jgi:hypothetical protein
MHLAFVFAVLTAFVGLTQTGTDDATRVRGTVVTAAARRPVPRALVVAWSGSDVRWTRADYAGRYVFLTLLPGVYRFVAYPGGMSPHSAGMLTPGCLGEQTDIELSAGVEYLANLELGCAAAFVDRVPAH